MATIHCPALALLLLALAPACVSQAKYDAAIKDADTLRGQLAKKIADDGAEMKRLDEALKAAERASGERDQKIGELSTDKQNLQTSLDEATALNQQMQAEIKRLGGDVDKMLADKSALAKSLEDAKARLEELRKAQAAAEARAAVFQQFVAKLKKMIDAGTLKVTVRRGRLVIVLPNEVLFDSGQAEVKPAGKTALQQIAAALKSIGDRQFQVSGHTDNNPIATAAYPSNWELSTKRAVNVVKLLVAEGVAPTTLSAAGYGEFDPIAPNDTPQNQAKNRRIEITLQPNVEDLVSMPNLDAQGNPTAAPPPAAH